MWASQLLFGLGCSLCFISSLLVLWVKPFSGGGRSCAKTSKRGFPSGTVFRALCFHCRGKGSVPGQGTKILHAAQLSPKIKEWGSFFNSSQCNLFALCIAYFPFQWHVGEKGDSLNLFSFSFFFSRLKNAPTLKAVVARTLFLVEILVYFSFLSHSSDYSQLPLSPAHPHPRRTRAVVTSCASLAVYLPRA